MRKEDAGYLPRAIQVETLSPVDEIHDPRSTLNGATNLFPSRRSDFQEKQDRPRKWSCAYAAAALTDFSGVGSLISSFRVGAATLGAEIVISSTPF